MHSFLVTGGTQNTRTQWIVTKLAEWGVGKFDVTNLDPEETSIGIAHVKDFQKKLYLQPNGSPYSVGVIRQGGTLTIEAQNALLKTLEEPPPHARVIVESPTADIFLPTIISRCQLIRLKNQEQFDEETLLSCLKTIEQIVNASIGKRLKLLDTVAKNKDEAAAWIDLAIAAAHKQILGFHTLLRALLRAKQHLSANVNYKLVIDTIFL